MVAANTLSERIDAQFAAMQEKMNKRNRKRWRRTRRGNNGSSSLPG